MKNKAVIDCLKPKKGKQIETPCEIKIKALKFIADSYNLQS